MNSEGEPTTKGELAAQWLAVLHVYQDTVAYAVKRGRLDVLAGRPYFDPYERSAEAIQEETRALLLEMAGTIMNFYDN